MFYPPSFLNQYLLYVNSHDAPTHPNNPLHGLQFERLLVALQHLFKVFIPEERQKTLLLIMVDITQGICRNVSVKFKTFFKNFWR